MLGLDIFLISYYVSLIFYKIFVISPNIYIKTISYLFYFLGMFWSHIFYLKTNLLIINIALIQICAILVLFMITFSIAEYSDAYFVYKNIKMILVENFFKKQKENLSLLLLLVFTIISPDLALFLEISIRNKLINYYLSEINTVPNLKFLKNKFFFSEEVLNNHIYFISISKFEILVILILILIFTLGFGHISKKYFYKI